VEQFSSQKSKGKASNCVTRYSSVGEEYPAHYH